MQVRVGRLWATIDDEDAATVMRYRWYAQPHGDLIYAVSRLTSWRKKPVKTLLMHRLILGPSKGQLVDHRDRNGLDNRRANLRLCTHAQNMQNRKMQRNSTTGYRGVYALKDGRTWRAEIYANGVRKTLGRFRSAEQAAIAYDTASLELHGEFGRRNF